MTKSSIRMGLLVAFSLMLAGCGTKVERRLDRLCSGLFPKGKPGAAVLIMQGDNILYDKGFGLSDLETKAPIDGNTSFNIASVSKQFTAVAVLQLVSEGKVCLDGLVRDYLPEYTAGIWDRITVAHLLSHSSGIPDLRGYLSRAEKITGDEDLALEYLATLDSLHFPPGTDYEYMNPTFVLLGRIVERVTGESFTDYVQAHIFDPAGMDRTCYFDRDRQEMIPAMAHGYVYEDAIPGMWHEYDFGEETFFATRPDGGIYTSTHEFVKWERALRACLSGPEVDTPDAILPDSLLLTAWTPHTLVSGSPWSGYQNRPGTWYGYGWFIEPAPVPSDAAWSDFEGMPPVADGTTQAPDSMNESALPQNDVPFCIYHTGDNGGFKILAARYPETKTLVLVFANRSNWNRYKLKTEVEEILGLKVGAK